MTVPGDRTSSNDLTEERAVRIPYPGTAIQILPPIHTYNASLHARLKIRDWLFSLREPMSGLTHFIGGLLSVAGLWILLDEASSPVRPWHLAGYVVFGLAMIMLYSISTLFHWLPLSRRGTTRMRKLDHIMIFMFIAATYTPFCIVPFRGAFGWTMLACIWVIAAMGSVFKLYWIHVPKSLCVLLYLCAGWFSLAGIGPIFRTLQPWAIFWLFAGGVSYCIGALFYVLDKHDDTPPFFGYHDIFHIFVILGSSAHFWVVYRYIGAFE